MDCQKPLLSLLVVFSLSSLEAAPAADNFRRVASYGPKLPPIYDLPSSWNSYRAPPPPTVPIRIGERRCDNRYHGVILPCLLRPQLPPFSYSTEANFYNTEYKKK